eukprot:11915003-Karenia_brevis.AAC.1
MEVNVRKEEMRAFEAAAREEVRSQASSSISGNLNPRAQRSLDRMTRERQLWDGHDDPLSSEITSPSYHSPSQSHMDMDTSNDSGNFDDVLDSPGSPMPPEAAPSAPKWEQRVF